MKKTILLLSSVIFLFSCEKDSINPESKKEKEYYYVLEQHDFNGVTERFEIKSTTNKRVMDSWDNYDKIFTEDTTYQEDVFTLTGGITNINLTESSTVRFQNIFGNDALNINVDPESELYANNIRFSLQGNSGISQLEVSGYTEVDNLYFTNVPLTDNDIGGRLIVNDTLLVKGDIIAKGGLDLTIGENGVLIVVGNIDVDNTGAASNGINGQIINNGKMFITGYLAGHPALDDNPQTPPLEGSIIRGGSIDNGDGQGLFNVCPNASIQLDIEGSINVVINPNVDFSFNDYRLTCANGLPIILTNFTVTPKEGENLIEFETTQEINSDYVSVLFSEDGVNNWIELTQIKSIYPSGGKYSYSHKLSD